MDGDFMSLARSVTGDLLLNQKTSLYEVGKDQLYLSLV